MLGRVLAHMRAQWAGFLALFLVLSGGAAYAANTIGSTDIINGQVKSADIGTGQVQVIDVKNEGLTGAEFADQSGVDSCTHETVRLGELCFRADELPPELLQALAVCASAGLRVPPYPEATALATHDLPDLDDAETFWTANYWTGEGSGCSWASTTAVPRSAARPPTPTRRPA